MAKCIALYLFLVYNTVDFIDCTKILVHGVPTKSHHMVVSAIAEELNSRGHEVILAMPSCMKSNNPLVKYYDGVPDEWCLHLNGTKASQPRGLMKGIRIVITSICDICKAFLSSDFFKEAQESGFDVLVAEVMTPCSDIIATKLDIPYVGISSGLILPHMKNWMPTSYSSFSYVPYIFSRNPSTGMNFFQRLKNFLCYVIISTFYPMAMNYEFDKMIKELDVLPGKSIHDIGSRADIVLTKGDFVFEEAQPLPPDVKVIGPVLVKEAKPLPDEYEKFMEGSGNDGIVYVSFGGTNRESSLTTVNQAIAVAVAKLPQKVIWKTKDNSSLTLGENTRTFTWVPQNDILGHPKTKVFITHAGQNSINEAIYHGVPIVSMPLFGDQPDNSQRLVSRQLAIEVNPRESKEDIEEQLFNVVSKMVNDISYKNKMMHLSTVLKSRRRTPLQEAGDWVEYVLKVKDLSHLKPIGNTLPFYQFYMLDVITVLGIACLLITLLFAALALGIFKCFKKMCGKKEKSKTA